MHPLHTAWKGDQADKAALHRYRATLWPDHIEAADAEEHAAMGALPTLQLKAPSAGYAARTAHALSGQRVLEVVRLEDAGVVA